MKSRNIKLEYDAEVDAAYLTLQTGKIAESEEVKPGLIVDFDADKQIIGVEILQFSTQFRPKAAARQGDAAKKAVGAMA